jgi:cysteine sulfinate desulfinase/cysteine desulfurase-like protein
MLGVERARSAVRISLGDATTGLEIEFALEAFARALRT